MGLVSNLPMGLVSNLPSKDQLLCIGPQPEFLNWCTRLFSSRSTCDLFFVLGECGSVIVTISVSFADSIRMMVKYGEEIRPGAHITLDAKIDRHLHECRGQRNFYITGFALFLIL